MGEKELIKYMLAILGNGFTTPGKEFRYSTGFLDNDLSECPVCGETENRRHKSDCKMVMFIDYLKIKAEEAHENSSGN